MEPEEFVVREQEIREAVSIFPDMEVGEAYRKYKEAKGETASMLQTGDPSLERAKQMVLKTFRRSCNQPGCEGTQLLEGVCEGCVEGKKGYKSKWTCEECMYRELSKRPYLDWYKELTKKEVAN
jgi:hypothetical protein